MTPSFSILPTHLHPIARAAMAIIKQRYGLPNPEIEREIDKVIPLQPTLHWQTKTYILACEIAERPFPRAIKETFADIVATGLPIKIIIAYPKDSPLNAKEYINDIKESKKFGIGYMAIDEFGKGTIEYQGVSLALHIPPIEVSQFHNSIRPEIADAFEKYMFKGDPDVALQKVGQLTENLIYNTATQAKANGTFRYSGFSPPKFIKQTTLIDKMIDETVIDVALLWKCKEFAKARNGVSHKPKTIKEAKSIEKGLKNGFSDGLRILSELPDKIKAKGYKVKC